MNPITLLVDTSTDPVIAAFDPQGNCIGRQKEKGGQAGSLDRMLEDYLRSYSAEYGDIEAVMVAKGPGSFTGLRVGIAFIQGLCFPRGLPVYPFSSLYPGLAALEKIGPGCFVIQAKQGFYYLASNVPESPGFGSEIMISTENLLKLADRQETLVTAGNIRDQSLLEKRFKNMVLLDGVYPYMEIWSYTRRQQPVTNGIICVNYVQLPAAEARRLGKESI